MPCEGVEQDAFACHSRVAAGVEFICAGEVDSSEEHDSRTSRCFKYPVEAHRCSTRDCHVFSIGAASVQLITLLRFWAFMW